MFHLRELKKKDLPVINNLQNYLKQMDCLYTSFHSINPDKDVKCYESYLYTCSNSIHCVIIEDESGKILGTVGLDSIDFMNQSAKFHMMIGDMQNQNHDAEIFAINAMLDHAFNNMGLKRVDLEVLASDTGAKLLYENCGFVYEGRKRKAKYKKGELVDMLIYSILKPEFLSKGVTSDLPTWTIIQALEKQEIDTVIRYCDDAFESPVAKRAIYHGLLQKLHQKGKCIFAYNGQILGYCAFYANDSEQKTAYISLVAVTPGCQKMHVGTRLLHKSFEIMKSYGMEFCLLEVRKNNINAIRFYDKNRFFVIEERLESYLMKCKL